MSTEAQDKLLDVLERQANAKYQATYTQDEEVSKAWLLVAWACERRIKTSRTLVVHLNQLKAFIAKQEKDGNDDKA